MQIRSSYRKPATNEPKPGRLVLIEAANEMCLAMEVKLGSDHAVLYLSGCLAGETDYYPGTGFLEYVGEASIRVSESPSAWVKQRPDMPVALWTDGLNWRFSARSPHGGSLNINLETGELGGAPYNGWFITDWRIADDDSQLLPLP